jgi:hypothetical protein
MKGAESRGQRAEGKKQEVFGCWSALSCFFSSANCQQEFIDVSSIFSPLLLALCPQHLQVAP